MRFKKIALALSLVISSVLTVLAQSKPKLTLDEFFNSASFSVDCDLARWKLRRHRCGARRLGPANLPQRSLALPRRR